MPVCHIDTVDDAGQIDRRVLSFLSADVDGYRYTLAVCVVYLQRCFLAMLDMLLVHKTSGCICECEESVIVRTHTVAVTREGIDEKFQLVIGSLADMNAHTSESILQMVRAFLNVCIHRNTDHQVEMGIDELLVFSRYHILHILDVLNGNLVTWIVSTCRPQ